jgi:gas vesicle protein
MSKTKKVVGSTLTLLAAGYVIGVLTAPRTGKDSRRLFRRKADNSVSDLEKQLKQMFNQTQDLIKKINSNKSVGTKMKNSKDKLLKNQQKIKELLSYIHGNDALDEDLTSAIDDAKKGLKAFANYLNK